MASAATSCGASACSSPTTSGDLAELQGSKQDMVLRVQSLKKELGDWRVRMQQQVEGCRSEFEDLQATLTREMGGLRGELAEVKQRIRAQLDSSQGAVRTLHARGDPPTRQHLTGAAAALAGAGAAAGMSGAVGQSLRSHT